MSNSTAKPPGVGQAIAYPRPGYSKTGKPLNWRRWSGKSKWHRGQGQLVRVLMRGLWVSPENDWRTARQWNWDHRRGTRDGVTLDTSGTGDYDFDIIGYIVPSDLDLIEDELAVSKK